MGPHICNGVPISKLNIGTPGPHIKENMGTRVLKIGGPHFPVTPEWNQEWNLESGIVRRLALTIFTSIVVATSSRSPKESPLSVVAMLVWRSALESGQKRGALCKPVDSKIMLKG